ncbi:MAG: methyltransferase domain-containing protein [Blastocatellia bacterium]
MSIPKNLWRNLQLFLGRDIRERLAESAREQQERADRYETAIDQRIEDRFAALAARLDQYEAALDRRFDERAAGLDIRLDQRLEANEKRLDDQFARNAQILDSRFDSRSAAVDARLDERLASLERHIDQRFNTLETRADNRMEAHERLVDGKLHNNREDIVTRTDLLLQVFEQRLDKQRRAIKSLGAAPGAQAIGEKAEKTESIHGLGAATDESSQLVSFRKLAAGNGAAVTSKLPHAGKALYDRILEWKKVAADELDQFTPDEQETVDYILSFISDPKELAYTRQHLRRFIATLQRIPPAQKSTDRLLELGSLIHMAPAVGRFCGYREISCADYWETEDKVTTETVRQVSGPDSYTFELKNFNVETDAFPYPDSHFRVVLCCELIEHLQRDPMHMLWECNRVLEPGGFLLLTTPNIASARGIEGLLVGCAPYLLSQYNLTTPADQHNREYAPYEIGVALAAAGFDVVELQTEDVWLRSNPAIIELLRQVDISTELRGDNIFALARKNGPPAERYPKELYIS